MALGEKISEFGTYAALIRRRRVWILTIVPAVLLICVFLAFWLPPQYRSTATIILEQGSIPQDLIKSTVNSAEQQIEVLEGRVMTIEALRALVKEYDPYPDQPGLDIDAKALRIVKDTSFERVDPVTFLPMEHSSAVSLYYQNPDPQRASIVARKLANLFLTYHQRVRQEAAKAAAHLVQKQADDLTQQLQAVDSEYARLRNANGGTLPDADGRGEDERYRAEHDLEDTERQLRAAQEQESQFSIQLSNTSPNLMTSKGDMTDIATVRAQLAEALQKYTPEHPDVKRLQRALAELQAQGAQATQGKTGATLAATADNPEYRKTASQLAAARADVAALQDSVARERAQLAQYTATVDPSAALERQVADLARRRASLQSQFQAVQETLKSAEFGQQVESDPHHAEHFALIQSPYPASQPYSPNRLGIILLGLVLGGALAAGAVAITESSDPTVRGAIDIASLGNVTILGNIPVILLRKDQIRSRLIWGGVTAVYIAALVVVIITVSRAQARVHHSEQTAALAANGF
ncbi:MAG TPA: Wzz/FepE/Etk N-terminal domain-containing protein [Steroidobacteraceae bacterium]